MTAKEISSYVDSLDHPEVFTRASEIKASLESAGEYDAVAHARLSELAMLAELSA